MTRELYTVVDACADTGTIRTVHTDSIVDTRTRVSIAYLYRRGAFIMVDKNVDIKSEASGTIQDVYIEVKDRMVDEE